jgi:hypothetical protein
MLRIILFQLFTVICFCSSCRFKDSTNDYLFTLLNERETGINFNNQLHDNAGANVFSYRNYYNGGGVAIGDVNNDGLNDIFLTSSQDDNQLYINKGDWQFENVSVAAGILGTKYWSTGVTMVDINHDGWLDIYVCNGGNTQGSEAENELYINQKNGTFKEEAQLYGLADRGLSTHAVFFDYDNDGDLDCFVLNNSFRPIGSFDFTQNLREIPSLLGGSRLYKNEDSRYVDVTSAAGIYSSDIGFGLGVSVADVNGDGYADIYVSNDFFERDYLYINQKNGKFKEDIQNQTGHLSLASMGSDIADINNDGLFDIFTTEMLPEDDKRLKQVTSFESYDVIKAKQRDGYFNQYMQNCLQLNNGNETFSEIAFYSGIAATDWSWGALIFDMDNDGWKDIFVSNGIYKDLTNQDYIEFLASKENIQKVSEGKNFDYHEFIDKMPSTPIPNYAYVNNKDLTFTNHAELLGLDQKSFSNGSAYGDLDNDGDYDLVINNVNMPAFIYRNNSEKLNNHAIKIKLEGDSLNRFGIGASIKVFSKHETQIYYHQPSRGFQSSISPNLINIGLGKETQADSVHVIWPNGKYQNIKDISSEGLNTFSIINANAEFQYEKPEPQKLLRDYTQALFDSIPQHREDEFIDFDRERLMLQMLSTENPFMASGDLNGDGLQDFYISASKRSEAGIYIQQNNGRFKQYIPDDFKKQVYLENAGAVFGDFDGDGDEDLVVTFGGNEEPTGSQGLYPRFYENDGTGKLHFAREKTIRIPVNASAIVAADYDRNGTLDLFIGGRSVPGLYGSFPASYVLKNDGKGNFVDVSAAVLGSDQHLGMVTTAKWVDFKNNGYPDLVIAGNWMGIKLFRNHNGKFTIDDQLANYKGWWSSLEVADVDGDGKLDIIAGNLGLNSKFKASERYPMKLFVKDFDQNGTKECILSVHKSDQLPYVWHMRPDLVAQLPSYKKKFLKYDTYAGKTFDKVFSDNDLKEAEVHEINFLQSAVFFNQGSGIYNCVPLPKEVQLAPVNTIICDDINGDGLNEIMLAGNFYGFKPEFGRLDASYGHVLQYRDNQFINMPVKQTGFVIKGQVRSALSIKNSKRKSYYIFGRNDDKLITYVSNMNK